jgi:hypothetical protein
VYGESWLIPVFKEGSPEWFAARTHAIEEAEEHYEYKDSENISEVVMEMVLNDDGMEVEIALPDDEMDDSDSSVDGDESMWDDDVSLPPHDKDHMDVD